MSPKRGDRVAPPPGDGEWDVRFAVNDAAKGWDALCRSAPGNARKAWELMFKDPGPGPGKPNDRHRPLKHDLASGSHGGRALPQWQIEVTGGGRVWYLLDAENRKVWVVYASPGHPKATE